MFISRLFLVPLLCTPGRKDVMLKKMMMSWSGDTDERPIMRLPYDSSMMTHRERERERERVFI